METDKNVLMFDSERNVGCQICKYFERGYDEYPCGACNACDMYTPKEERRKSETVNHPAHYQGKNECIDVMIAMFGKEAVKHFCMCNAYKYRYRADKKNGEEDIKKAEWYETKLMELGGCDES